MEKPIRILQRPCQSSDNQASITSKPPVAVRSLEQREAEYAAARRRIMGSDGSETDEDSTNNKESMKTASSNGYGNSVSRQSSPPVVGVSTATPLMSIQASPSAVNSLTPEFGSSVVNPPLNGFGMTQPRVSNSNARQGYAVVNVAQKLQQQPIAAPNGTRPVLPSQQPQRLLSGSASSPSFFSNSRTTTHQSIPLFPSHANAANTGLLPTPPGFNYSVQNATLNGSGSGMHHSHSAAYALMQQFGLFQQQYQQALNGFQNQILPPAMSHTGASFNPFHFSLGSQSTTNQKFTHPPTFN